jgi:hypothetical protein
LGGVARGKGFYYCTGQLVEDALRVARGMSYADLSSLPSESLVRLSRRITESRGEFARECSTPLSRVEFDPLELVFRAALPRIAAVLEERGESHYDPVLASLYTAGERALAADLERFEALDPDVTPTHVLALNLDGGGDLHSLVREAVESGYVDFKGLLDRLAREKVVRRENTDVFTYLYADRFSNILRAAKMLIDQKPQAFTGLLEAAKSQAGGSAGETNP